MTFGLFFQGLILMDFWHAFGRGRRQGLGSPNMQILQICKSFCSNSITPLPPAGVRRILRATPTAAGPPLEKLTIV